MKRFQRRHGLEPDAAIGPAIVARLNVPVERRIEEIALNLERWRWLPQDLGRRYILVNIPEFRLEVWEQHAVPLSMRVVVGKQDTPTPIFADDMTYIVFAPYWNVPANIAKNETVPSALKDPAFLRRTNMEIVDKSGTPVDPASVDLENASRLPLPAAAGRIELARAGQVHVPEFLQRLPARHAGGFAVRARDAFVQPRLRSPRAARAARAVPARGSA